MAAEIISTVERRRHWPDGEKLRILSEALAPGATVAAVADGNGVCRSLVYLWLRLARAGRLPGISLADPPCLPTQGTSFVPVRIEPLGKTEAARNDSGKMLSTKRLRSVADSTVTN